MKTSKIMNTCYVMLVFIIAFCSGMLWHNTIGGIGIKTLTMFDLKYFAWVLAVTAIPIVATLVLEQHRKHDTSSLMLYFTANSLATTATIASMLCLEWGLGLKLEMSKGEVFNLFSYLWVVNIIPTIILAKLRLADYQAEAEAT